MSNMYVRVLLFLATVRFVAATKLLSPIQSEAPLVDTSGPLFFFPHVILKLRVKKLERFAPKSQLNSFKIFLSEYALDWYTTVGVEEL